MKAKVRNLAAVAAAVVALILSAVLFAACGSGVTGVEGLYKFSSAMSGETVVHVGEEYNGIETNEDFFTVELKEDGVCVVTVSIAPDGTLEGTWTLEGTAITLTFVDDNGVEMGTVKGTLSDGTMILTAAVPGTFATVELKK